MNTIVEESVLTTLTGDARLVEERRHATAIPEGVLLWHYVPDAMWENAAGALRVTDRAALIATCSDIGRAVLRDKLPEWLLIGTSRNDHGSPNGAVFCLICYEAGHEVDARAWLEEVFLPALAPEVSAAVLGCVARAIPSVRRLEEAAA